MGLISPGGCFLMATVTITTTIGEDSPEALEVLVAEVASAGSEAVTSVEAAPEEAGNVIKIENFRI